MSQALSNFREWYQGLQQEDVFEVQEGDLLLACEDIDRHCTVLEECLSGILQMQAPQPNPSAIREYAQDLVDYIQAAMADGGQSDIVGSGYRSEEGA